MSAKFYYTCSKCGALMIHRRESGAPQQSLGKFHCEAHGRVPVVRKPVKEETKEKEEKHE